MFACRSIERHLTIVFFRMSFYGTTCENGNCQMSFYRTTCGHPVLPLLFTLLSYCAYPFLFIFLMFFQYFYILCVPLASMEWMTFFWKKSCPVRMSFHRTTFENCHFRMSFSRTTFENWVKRG